MTSDPSNYHGSYSLFLFEGSDVISVVKKSIEYSFGFFKCSMEDTFVLQYVHVLVLEIDVKVIMLIVLLILTIIKLQYVSLCSDSKLLKTLYDLLYYDNDMSCQENIPEK